MRRWILSLLLLFSALALSGCCGKRIHTHPYKTQQEFEQDQHECEKVVEESIQGRRSGLFLWRSNTEKELDRFRGRRGGFFSRRTTVNKEVDRCLRMKGWQPVEGQ
jgi:hypothetical protein